MKSYIGIDPGQTGAIAVIHPDGYEVYDWPGDEVLAAEIVGSLCTRFRIALAAVEQVSAMPGQGVVSQFKFGANFGAWKGILASFRVPFRTVRPQEWQKGLVPKNDGTEKPSLAVARRMFPAAELSRKKDHGRADALLIAEWARRRG